MQADIASRFGRKVREKRQAVGISQERLAELAGVHRTYVGMIERGEKNVTLRNIEKLAKALKTPIHELMNLD
jgi:transcriptional regulator with XRE-family HTH domain